MHLMCCCEPFLEFRTELLWASLHQVDHIKKVEATVRGRGFRRLHRWIALLRNANAWFQAGRDVK